MLFFPAGLRGWGIIRNFAPVKMKRIIAILALMCSLAVAMAADVQVSLITCYPGSEVYELDGHTALRVRGDGFDSVINWGIFDFDTPNFIYRFLKGETDYMVAEVPYELFISSYGRSGRKVVEQPLEADSLSVQRLCEMLRYNLLPGNRVYRYNYVKDNCATRPMQMIERSGAGVFDRKYVGDERTFRQVMRRYHAAYPWYQFGIDLALGSGIDYVITPGEQAFSPMLLMQMLPVEPRVIIEDAGGGPAEATPLYLTPMAVFLAVMLAVWVVLFRSVKRGREVKWLYTVFYGALGIVGCGLAFLIFVSVHEATSPNWLLLFFNPLCLVPAIFIWVKRARKLVVWYQMLNFALIIAGSVLWPLTGQSMNYAVIPILLADISLSATYLYINYRNKALNA